MAIKQSDIKASLAKQLKDNGANTEHFSDLINDYMELWKLKNKLIKDIKTRGLTYESTSSAGKTYEKENPSIKQLMLTNRQMLAILKDLKLSTDTVVEDDDDEL